MSDRTTDPRPALVLSGVNKTYTSSYRGGRLTTRAARDVSLELQRGDAFGLVGESGSGKTTLARMIMGLERPDSGTISIAGRAVTGRRSDFPYGRVQIVFQDPRSSLDPRMTIRDILREPLRGLDRELRRALGTDPALREMLERVGMHPDHLGRRSHQFSGGQRQRIAIARALVTRPTLVVLDEPTSALDVSIQAQILNLLRALQAEYELTYLFISHDLAVVRHLCNRVAVISRGEIVESGPTRQIFDAPGHEYTQRLLAAAPRLLAG
jgi:ABC-type glutathione transport system ATPase component